MAWIAVVPRPPPPARALPGGQAAAPAGIFPTKRRAEVERRALERGRDELVDNRGG
jgi:hypothetical protein